MCLEQVLLAGSELSTSSKLLENKRQHLKYSLRGMQNYRLQLYDYSQILSDFMSVVHTMAND